MPFEPTDFRVGLDIGICGRAIRIYDADEYTRAFFDVSILLKYLLLQSFKLRNGSLLISETY